MPSIRMPSSWPETVDEIIGGDQALAFAYVTPASGVVLTPLTNTGLRDRRAGTMTPVSSSVAMWRKLERVRRNPKVAIAYHTREHGFSDRPEYVLVQGTASLTPVEDRDWVERHLENWERFSGKVSRGLPWEPWQSVYHWRVGVELEVERVVVWPDLACRGERTVHGAPLPEHHPAPQSPPARGTGPRIDHRRAAARARRLPNVLLGWVAADGFPMVVPAEVGEAEEAGIGLQSPERTVPPGGRRAGFLAHSFARYTYGQNQLKHTGWLEVDGERVVYAPHTKAGYRFPPSTLLYRLVTGFVTHRRLRDARRAGFVPG